MKLIHRRDHNNNYEVNTNRRQKTAMEWGKFTRHIQEELEETIKKLEHIDGVKFQGERTYATLSRWHCGPGLKWRTGNIDVRSHPNWPI